MGGTKKSQKDAEQFQQYILSARNTGIDNVLVVRTSDVYTAPWVRMKCQFGCAGYGETLCCPPYTPTPDEMRAILDSYTYGILLHRHWKKDYQKVNDFNETIVDLERIIFLDGYYKAWSLGSGPCHRCETCNIPGICRYSERARPAMEGCGIDVFKTARKHGLPINVVRSHTQERDIYGLVLIE